MAKRIGNYTITLDKKPVITAYAAVAGKQESEGPLGKEFDAVFTDTTLGEDSWERSESKLMNTAIRKALEKGNKTTKDVDFIFGGDLLSQCIATSFGIRDLNIPFIGMYGACSTMALSLANASMYLDGGAANLCIAATCSHFCSAERQFRYPLEYGGQRPPSSQWTVTGSGAAMLETTGNGPVIEAVSLGRIIDMGITDANNMGAAMAPAAAATIADFLDDTGTKPEDYDMILTGDLGSIGSMLCIELLNKDHKYDISGVHYDCGMMIFDPEKQDVHAGGSGCGCSASVLCSHILKRIENGDLKKVLFVATGALLSATSAKQKESIPSIAHAVLITGGGTNA